MGLEVKPGPPQTPVGAMSIWLTDTAPAGWLLCYGQAISRAIHAKLFGIIGTTFGIGDGSTTFNLPDMRGREPLGKDNMGGVSANRVTNAQADSIGGNTGAENHQLTTPEMPVHGHNHNHAHDHQVDTVTGSGGSKNGFWERDDGTSYGSIDTSSDNTSGSANAGSGSNHNNMSPYLTTNYIIRC